VPGSRPFIATAGGIFGLIFIIHVARIAFEGTGALYDTFFIGATVVALAAAIWAVVLLRKPSA